VCVLQVNAVVEEEYCLIPMGGVLPRRDQRVIGIGGTAGLVHPSTGYMVARTLGAVPQLADRVVDEVATFKRHGAARGALSSCSRMQPMHGAARVVPSLALAAPALSRMAPMHVLRPSSALRRTRAA
jgi:Lycopene cyclase protein